LYFVQNCTNKSTLNPRSFAKAEAKPQEHTYGTDDLTDGSAENNCISSGISIIFFLRFFGFSASAAAVATTVSRRDIDVANDGSPSKIQNGLRVGVSVSVWRIFLRLNLLLVDVIVFKVNDARLEERERSRACMCAGEKEPDSNRLTPK
jgi:hypothetical protein